MTYTLAAVIGVAFAALLDLALLRTKLLQRKTFWASYAIIVCFQLLVNGILTGRRLVVYSPSKILGTATPHLLGGWRIADAPVEDLLFGFSLVLQTLSWWLWWGRRLANHTAGANALGGRGAATRPGSLGSTAAFSGERSGPG